jgi:hypothetical protein
MCRCVTAVYKGAIREKKISNISCYCLLINVNHATGKSFLEKVYSLILQFQCRGTTTSTKVCICRVDMRIQSVCVGRTIPRLRYADEAL